ncbi:hypothetical protein EZS27_021276 [termite gut metagenome]|jgi:hypothetical protein|uniref:Tetratricopeptide repeat protein n=1 Tax=termite gut metagenome TaxID=433724 RepID=A0A5J4R7K5_9ZZZZ
MTATNLQQWISSPELLNRDTLYELHTALARYPCCQTLRLLYLRNLYLLQDDSFSSELRKAALYVGDRRAFFYLIEGGKYVLWTGISAAVGTDQTLKLIDAFLSQTQTSGEILSASNNIEEYTADYTSYLLKEDDNRTESPDIPKLHGHELIDHFIEKAKDQPLRIKPIEEDSPFEEVSPDMKDGESCFTETLAKIYIKQKKYAKALEIIRNLSIKNPEKSTYFANQIRFLEKLIINTKS